LTNLRNRKGRTVEVNPKRPLFEAGVASKKERKTYKGFGFDIPWVEGPIENRKRPEPPLNVEANESSECDRNLECFS